MDVEDQKEIKMNNERLHKEVRRKCNEAKETWLDQKSREVDLLRRFNPHIIYKNVAEITGRKACTSTGCLKAKNGDVIMEKDKILERWAEYMRELYDNDRKENDFMKNNFAGPPIMKNGSQSSNKDDETRQSLGTR